MSPGENYRQKKIVDALKITMQPEVAANVAAVSEKLSIEDGVAITIEKIEAYLNI